MPRSVYDSISAGDSFEVLYWPEQPQQNFAEQIEREQMPPALRWMAAALLAGLVFVFDRQRRVHKTLVVRGKPVAGVVEDPVGRQPHPQRLQQPGPGEQADHGDQDQQRQQRDAQSPPRPSCGGRPSQPEHRGNPERENHRPRPFARRREASLDDELIEAKLGHGRMTDLRIYEFTN